jgi:hypothetical protein
MQLEGLGQLKIATSSGLGPATFRLVEWCLNQLRYRVPPVRYPRLVILHVECFDALLISTVFRTIPFLSLQNFRNADKYSIVNCPTSWLK